MQSNLYVRPPLERDHQSVKTKNWVFLLESGTAKKNNCLLSSIFPAGECDFGQMLYRSPEWSCTSGLPGWIFFVQCPATSASMFSVFLDYIFRVCQSLWDSFLYLGKLHWFLYLLLSYFYDPGLFISRWSSNFG